MTIFNHFRKLDWVIIICTIFLVGFGLLSIYSQGDFYIFKKQIIFLVASFILMFLISFFDWRGFRENPYFILVLYFFCLILLAGLYFFAPEIRGVKSWYKIGPFSFDPISVTTLVLIILLAKFFSMRNVEMYRLSHILLSGLYILLPIGLVFFQPDLGPVLILVALWIGILVISGIKLKNFAILTICGLLILILNWSFLLKEYQKERVMSFLSPQIEPLGVNWSQNQAKIAIGSGGIFGKGIGKGSQTQYGFLPEPHTDFIFAAIAEEFGLTGIIVLLSLFGVLIWRIMKIALSAESNFPRLFASGLVIVLVSQIFIHIGMNLGILPVIGIAFPFVSYGGSNLIAIFMGLGVLQSIKTH